MGSTNALRFAIEYNTIVSELVLVGAFASYRHNPTVLEFWNSAVSELTDPINPVFVREIQKRTIAKSVPEAFLETIFRESLKFPASGWRPAFEGFLEDDFSGELGRIKASSLILWGNQDILVAMIMGPQHLVYENAGHGLHWEETERFAADLVKAFVKSLGISTGDRRYPAGRICRSSDEHQKIQTRTVFFQILLPWISQLEIIRGGDRQAILLK
jgi:pimeloyl-ACP methyl ester carboxylesterase